MSVAALLRVEKLEVGGIQVELGSISHIDPARTRLNEALRGAATTDEVAFHDAHEIFGEAVVKMKTIGLSKQKDRKAQSLEDALKHNLRLIKAEGLSFKYNPALSVNNRILGGATTPMQGRAYLEALFAEHELAPRRRDYVQAIELLFTAPPCLNPSVALSYLEASFKWTGDYYGEKMLINGALHLDEAEPHLHVLVAPLIVGESGYRLGGSLLIKGRAQDAASKAFNKAVANAYGLRVRTFQEYSDNKPKRIVLAAQVIKYLIASNAPETVGSLWGLIEANINRNPALYAKALGLSTYTNFSDLAASTGKGLAKEAHDKTKSFKVRVPEKLQFESKAENPKSSLCIDFARDTPAPLATKPPQGNPKVTPRVSAIKQDSGMVETETKRIRESENDPAYFNPETGEFMKPPQTTRLNRAAADSCVAGALNQHN